MNPSLRIPDRIESRNELNMFPGTTLGNHTRLAFVAIGLLLGLLPRLLVALKRQDQ